MSTRYRTVSGLAEVEIALRWAADEGWNPGLEDSGAFLAADPNGFFVAEADGRPVAAISVVNQSDTMAFLGLYLCLPAYRGRGIGFSLWKHALDHAGGRTVGLDGVAAQQGNYARSGFVLAGATTRFEGRLDPAEHSSVRPATPGDADAIASLDRAANGYDRPAFLTAWTAEAATRKTVILDDGAVTGFATIRQCRDGAKIGPIVAPDAEAALTLARAAVAALPAGTSIIDLPAASRDLAARLRTLGFADTFATARMYRGAPPKPGAPGSCQAIATMELG